MGTLTFLDTGTRVEVPNDPEQERATVAAHPELRAALAESRARGNRGEEAMPIEEYMARNGITPPAPRRKPTGKRPTAGSGKVSLRLPTDLHDELIVQAQRQGVSLNTLMVAYLAREVGAEAVRAAAKG